MNTVQLYIEDDLNVEQLKKLKQLLLDTPKVTDVEISSKSPHEFLIEFEEHHNLPMKIIEIIKEQGYHPDIYSG